MTEKLEETPLTQFIKDMSLGTESKTKGKKELPIELKADSGYRTKRFMLWEMEAQL